MANISALGNQIYLNQNISAIANKYVNSHARLLSQDLHNSDSFQENHKRLKDTREMEGNEAINENLLDDAVYSVKAKYKRRNREENETEKENKYIIDEPRKKIDIKI